MAHKSLERQAAYNVASKEISEWQDIITSNRSAKQLDLRHELPPLPTIELVTKDHSTEGLHYEVNQALGITDTAEPDFDNTGEKSKLRSEMFYQYQKQKRIAKIKSKLYHKIRNKRKDGGSGVPLDEEEKIAQENLVRIEERMSLRHSANKLKKTLGRYARDEGKKIISENEDLRHRIRNPSRVNSEGRVTYDSSSEDDEAFLTDQLKLELEGEGHEQKGIMGMKFMQEAAKRQREMEASAQDLLNDIYEESSKFKYAGKPQKKQKVEEGEGKSVRGKGRRVGKDGEGEGEREGEGEERKKKRKEKQEEKEAVIEEAFETDEMDQIAAEEWAKEQQEKAEKVPKTLNGWGSWFGSGIRQRKAPQPLTVYKVDKVVEFQERDKRAAKYMVKSIPFPFKTARQFDAVHKIPIGKEWNSKRVYQKQIAPEILTRAGEIIDPISK